MPNDELLPEDAKDTLEVRFDGVDCYTVFNITDNEPIKDFHTRDDAEKYIADYYSPAKPHSDEGRAMEELSYIEDWAKLNEHHQNKNWAGFQAAVKAIRAALSDHKDDGMGDRLGDFQRKNNIPEHHSVLVPPTTAERIMAQINKEIALSDDQKDCVMLGINRALTSPPMASGWVMVDDLKSVRESIEALIASFENTYGKSENHVVPSNGRHAIGIIDRLLATRPTASEATGKVDAADELNASLALEAFERLIRANGVERTTSKQERLVASAAEYLRPYFDLIRTRLKAQPPAQSWEWLEGMEDEVTAAIVKQAFAIDGVPIKALFGENLLGRAAIKVIKAEAEKRGKNG